MSRFDARLREGTTVLLDGGMGEQIREAGIDVRNSLWGSAALLTPEGRAINDTLHQRYADAGAELLIANTHNASLQNCRRFLRGEGDAQTLLEELNGTGIESARRTGCLIAGCLSSPDTPYTTIATLTPREVTAALRPQYDVLAALRPDLIIFEMLTTISDLEGVAALVDDRGPIGVGLVCSADGHLLCGVPLAEAVHVFDSITVAAFFVQCTPLTAVDVAIGPLVAAAGDRAAIGVYANNGHGESASPEAYAAAALAWRDAGARIIGGCCGTGPEHIAALSRRVRTK